MNKLANFILAITLAVLNILLAFWALGVAMNQWNLSEEFGHLLTFPNFIAVTMLLGINEARSFGSKLALQDRVGKLDGADSSVESTLKAAMASSLGILLTLVFSWIWSVILL